MKKLFLIFGSILLSAAAAAAQDTPRIFELPPDPPPGSFLKAEDGKMLKTELKGVELVEITIDGKPVTAGRAFAAGDDWLMGLKIKLRNASDKPITSVAVSFSLPEAKYGGGSLGFSLAFGSLSPMFESRKLQKIVQPGEEFELMQTEQEYAAYQNFRLSRVGVVNITRVRIGTTTVRFEDGNLWLTLKLPPVQRAE